ncbi:MAG TPA: CHASE domain-containing protein [Candidatus Saccharimonadales bacterium]|nr:CHASE domain-containing protein [Candidatus Saccharimonadales bacterium]
MDPFRRAVTAALSCAKSVYRSLYFPPTVICAAIIVASIFGWQAAKTSLAHDLRTAEDVRVATAEQSVRSYISSYEQILRGGVGLFQGSDQVTRNDWANYLNAFTSMRNYPGVQGIGYAPVVTPDQLPALQDFMASEGTDNFAIYPADPPRAVYAPVIYLQAIAATAPPTYGFDMYSQPTRKAAMLAARDQNRTTITPRIELMSSTGARPVGFNMYAPYYGPSEPASLAARQQNIRGYVYASFRADVFFKRIVSELNKNILAFQITVQGDKLPLYTSPSYASISKHAGFVDRSMDVYGQTWQMRYAINDQLIVSSVQLKRPGGVLFFGLFTAILVSMIIYLVLRGRAKDLTTQKERAVELAKDELLSLASHQLRTPATGVKQYVGMVLQGFAGDISDEQKALLEKAYASNDRQLRIINEILHLAKIGSGRIVLAKTLTNLNELVGDVINEQRGDIAAARHTLKVRLAKKPIMANVDTHTLRMAIENLLSNAIKYTAPGGKITVGTRRGRYRAFISVQDTGVGIGQGDLDKIFRQFSRLPNEMSQSVEGTGIGLYLAKHLVELHKGAIQVVSESGKGSTFVIELPAKAEPMRNLTASKKR